MLKEQTAMDNISIVLNKCVGCKSCEQICPRQCIVMETNHEGFWYPIVDNDKCAKCHLCLKTCPVMHPENHRNEPQSAWALRNKNDFEIMKSASGGASDLAAKVILNQDGIVYGAAYDDFLAVRHIEITQNSEREKLQSSKYVQSDTASCYSKAKKRLAEGRVVLFTGTPCQIAGLYSYLGKEDPNLYTIDLICHGVPSPKFFQKYLEYQSRKIGEQIISYNFRSKDKRGWGTQFLFKTQHKSKTNTLSLDRYGKHFIQGNCYRESCYQCIYANLKRTGDLTIGDFWGVFNSHPDFFSSKGVSCVFINTLKGQVLFEMIKDFAYTEKITLEESLIKQGNLRQPSRRPSNRDEFYSHIDECEYMDQLYVGLQLKERVKAAIPVRIIHLLKRLEKIIQL